MTISDGVLAAIVTVLGTGFLGVVGWIFKLNSKITSMGKDIERIQGMLINHDKADEHTSGKFDKMSQRIDDGFDSTDEMLTGLTETIAELRGELRGRDVIK